MGLPLSPFCCLSPPGGPGELGSFRPLSWFLQQKLPQETSTRYSAEGLPHQSLPPAALAEAAPGWCPELFAPLTWSLILICTSCPLPLSVLTPGYINPGPQEPRDSSKSYGIPRVVPGPLCYPQQASSEDDPCSFRSHREFPSCEINKTQ